MMAKSGCVKCLIGVESGDEEHQKRLGKYIGRKHLTEVLRALNKNGIGTFLTYLCGFPGETAQTVKATIDSLNEAYSDGMAVHEYCVFKFAAMPLSKISLPKFRKPYNLKGSFLTWSHNTMNSEEVDDYMVPWRKFCSLTMQGINSKISES